MSAALAAGVLLRTPPAAAAGDDEPVKGSGAVGGALIATEAVLVTEALAGVRPSWVYWVSAIAGAALGGYVGSRIEQRTEPEVPHVMLGAGLAFVLPTVVWFGNLRDTETKAPHAPSSSLRQSHIAVRESATPKRSSLSRTTALRSRPVSSSDGSRPPNWTSKVWKQLHQRRQLQLSKVAVLPANSRKAGPFGALSLQQLTCHLCATENEAR